MQCMCCCYQLKFIYSNLQCALELFLSVFFKNCDTQSSCNDTFGRASASSTSSERVFKILPIHSAYYNFVVYGCDNFAYICMLPTLIFLSNNFHEATICLNNVIQLHCMFVRPFQYCAML